MQTHPFRSHPSCQSVSSSSSCRSLPSLSVLFPELSTDGSLSSTGVRPPTYSLLSGTRQTPYGATTTEADSWLPGLTIQLSCSSNQGDDSEYVDAVQQALRVYFNIEDLLTVPVEAMMPLYWLEDRVRECFNVPEADHRRKDRQQDYDTAEREDHAHKEKERRVRHANINKEGDRRYSAFVIKIADDFLAREKRQQADERMRAIEEKGKTPKQTKNRVAASKSPTKDDVMLRVLFQNIFGGIVIKCQQAECARLEAELARYRSQGPPSPPLSTYGGPPPSVGT